MLPVRCFLGCFSLQHQISSACLVLWGTGLSAERVWSKARDGVIDLILFHKTHRRKSGNYTL